MAKYHRQKLVYVIGKKSKPVESVLGYKIFKV